MVSDIPAGVGKIANLFLLCKPDSAYNKYLVQAKSNLPFGPIMNHKTILVALNGKIFRKTIFFSLKWPYVSFNKQCLVPSLQKNVCSAYNGDNLISPIMAESQKP